MESRDSPSSVEAAASLRLTLPLQSSRFTVLTSLSVQAATRDREKPLLQQQEIDLQLI